MDQSALQVLFTAELWDLRTSMERQLRCLVAIQRKFDESRTTTNDELRTRYRHEIRKDLADVQATNEAIASALPPLVRLAEELSDATPPAEHDQASALAESSHLVPHHDPVSRDEIRLRIVRLRHLSQEFEGIRRELAQMQAGNTGGLQRPSADPSRRRGDSSSE